MPAIISTTSGGIRTISGKEPRASKSEAIMTVAITEKSKSFHNNERYDSHCREFCLDV